MGKASGSIAKVSSNIVIKTEDSKLTNRILPFPRGFM